MKKFYGVLALSAACVFLSLSSCKKGEGDPFFSLYTRSARLCGEWKVYSYNRTVSSGNKAWVTTIEGDKRTFTAQVDTLMIVLVPVPHDTVFTLETKHTWTGSVQYDFIKDGTYAVLENFKDDSTAAAWTSEEKGRWCFLSGNKELGYKNKELLALQPSSGIYNPDAGNSISTRYTGNNDSYVFEIFQLKSKEIIFRVNTEETVNSTKVSTTMEMTLKPR